VTWYNVGSGSSPIISINDYANESVASKVMYKANGTPNDNSLLNKSMGVYINHGPDCDSTAANYREYTMQAESDLTAICTHKYGFSSIKTAVDRCPPLVNKATCDAALEGSDLSCEWKVNTRICFQGKKWKKVKSLPYDSATWYTTTDNLAGTDVVGTGLDDSVQWSKAFSTETYDAFLFASGDFSIWI
jgi:hypothetical protein